MLFGKEKRAVERIVELSDTLTKGNSGDVFLEAIDFYTALSPEGQRAVEQRMKKIRDFSRNAEVGWTLFEYSPNVKIEEVEYIQIIFIVEALRQIGYCFERLEEVAFFTGGTSTPVRFYLNSLYHYIAAMFLIDKDKNNAMGGSVIKCLKRLGLDQFLLRIGIIFDKKFGGEFTIGETLRHIRNKFLVHSSFSPEDVESMLRETEFRRPSQMEFFTQQMWLLFFELSVLKLKLIALLTKTDRLPDDVLQEYMKRNS